MNRTRSLSGAYCFFEMQSSRTGVVAGGELDDVLAIKSLSERASRSMTPRQRPSYVPRRGDHVDGRTVGQAPTGGRVAPELRGGRVDERPSLGVAKPVALFRRLGCVVETEVVPRKAARVA